MAMDQSIKDTIERCAAASYAGTITFGEVVMALQEQGVESYRVDYRLRSAAYYLPSGETHSLPVHSSATALGDAFDSAALQAAIRGAQRNEVTYPEFIRRSSSAGCIGYIVWIAGKHVTYFGRRGEIHTEHFPGSRDDGSRRV